MPLTAIGGATLAALVGWFGLELVATILLVASAIPAATVVRRVVIALPVFVAAMSLAFTVLSVLGLTPDLRWTLLAVALVSFVAAVVAPPASIPFGDAADAWSAVTSLAAMAVVARSAFTWSSGDILARLATHTDAIRHITLGAVVERHDGYVTLASNMEHLLPGLQRYPQGGAGFIAVALRAFSGSRPDVASTVVVGYWVLVGVLALTVWMTTTLAIVIARRSSAHELSWRQLGAAALVVGLTAVVGPQFLTYELGYFAQEVATVALLGSLCVMIESGWRLRTAVTLVALVVAVAQSWYLLTPIIVGAIAWWWWGQHRRRLLVIPAIVAAPFIAFPFIAGPSPTEQLLATGNTPAPTEFAVAALIVGGGAGLVALGVRPLRARAGGVFVVAMVLLAALTVAVGILELARGGADSTYYAIKLFVLLLLFAGVAMGAGLSAAMHSRTSRDGVLAATTGVATVVIAAAGWSYFADKSSDPPPRTAHEAQFYLDHAGSIQPKAIVLAYDGCGRADRFLSHAFANFSMEFSPEVNPDFADFMNARDGDAAGIATLLRHVSGRSVEFITDRPCAPQEVTRLDDLPRVTVLRSAKSTP
jgi:hypothetical protein